MHDPCEQAPSLRTSGWPGRYTENDEPLPPGRAGVSCAWRGDRIRVTVRGELDLDSGKVLRADLGEVLAGPTSGVDLDLSRLDFCDCAGLEVLLELRRSALEQGKTVVIRTSNPVIDRLLTLLGAQELFASAPRQCAERVTTRLAVSGRGVG